MAKRSTAYAYAYDDQQALVSGQFTFHPDLPVTQRSRFGDNLWDWFDENNERFKVVGQCKLRFDWSAVTVGVRPLTSKAKSPAKNRRRFIPQLPKDILEDLRRAFYITSLFPWLIRGKRKCIKKPITIVAEIAGCINFLSHIYLERLRDQPRNRITKLSDVTLVDIRKAIETYPYALRDMKVILMLLAGEVVQVNLKHGRLQWSTYDIKRLHWPKRQEDEPIPSLPDDLFALLSNTSADLILEFHLLLGNATRDASTESARAASIQRNWPRFREMYNSYLGRRQILRLKGPGWVSVHTRRFVKAFGFEPRILSEFLFDVRVAAFQIILLYTGMRYSELASLQRGCLIKRNGITLIKSTLIKGVPSNLPIDRDEWVAIPIVEDAIGALEELSRCNFNNFLVSNFDTVKVGGDENPLTLKGLTWCLNVYLDKIDERGIWKDWEITAHQYRHGLALQLAEADVGIPYITRQLKHYHSLLSERSYKINPTTTIYGMQRQRIVNNATGLRAFRSAKVRIANDLYGERRRFAGGGATLHVKRTEGFFRGIGLEGKAREQYIEKLAEFGGTEIRTGVGFCLRNHVDPRKLAEAPPPCIGDLQCNPHTCVYSVVPEGRKADVITRYRYAAKQLDSPDQSHLRPHWEAELNAHAAMLQQLGVDPRNLRSAVLNPDTVATVLAGA
ncbi:MAG TPA: site-specific integrase [Pyrinomonadaceae bacterium]|nr:site-specific integrase [Pyrinomonadaceae bacterium]